jgi:transposase
VSDDVMIAVGPHKASNTAAVLDPVPETVIESARFANTMDGYAQLTAFAGRWGQRRWAVEGCFGAGRSLAQRLVADGEMVLDVPAKLAARVRVYSRGHGRKTDRHDAVSVGLAALDGTGVLAVAGDDALVSLRLLCDRRDELTALRTQAVCRLHRLLAELTPGGMRRELTANKAQALLALIRPADDVGRVRVHIARDHLADIRALDARIKYIGTQIAALVTALGTGLTGLFGVGPVIAGRLLAETGDVARFATKDTFASYNGTAPIDVSSGDQIRHPALARREPADQPRPAHDGGHPDPLPRHPRPPVLRTQTNRGQDTEGSPAVPQAAAVRPGLLPAHRRPAGHNRRCGSGRRPAAHRLSPARGGRVCSPGSSGTTAMTTAMSNEMARSSRNAPSAW